MATEEYLTIKELAQRIRMPEGTIRNLIWKKKLVQGVHYLKPTPKKLIFVWSAVEDWLHGRDPQTKGKCLIKIYNQPIDAS